jgi:large subunit ribosomal protein L32e
MSPIKFLRRSHDRYSKIGKRRKKKLKWRRPTGRDNKMREKRRGYPAVVSIGYKQSGVKERIMIMNVKDLDKVGKEKTIILGKVGKKKQIEIVKKAEEKKIKIQNINTKKIIKKLEKSTKENK